MVCLHLLATRKKGTSGNGYITTSGNRQASTVGSFCLLLQCSNIYRMPSPGEVPNKKMTHRKSLDEIGHHFVKNSLVKANIL